MIEPKNVRGIKSDFVGNGYRARRSLGQQLSDNYEEQLKICRHQ